MSSSGSIATTSANVRVSARVSVPEPAARSTTRACGPSLRASWARATASGAYSGLTALYSAAMRPKLRASSSKARPVSGRADRPAVLDVGHELPQLRGQLDAVCVRQRRDRADREHARDPLVARPRNPPLGLGLPERFESRLRDRLAPVAGENLSDAGRPALRKSDVEDAVDLLAHRRLGVAE